MKLALLGDLALFGRMSVNENPHIQEYFSDISDYLGQFDYVVGNLETPFSVLKKTNGAKSAFICSDVENVATLKQLHVKAVCLANNHMFDFGKEGYETTKRILEENGISYFGTEGRDLYIENGDNKIAFSGFCCYSSNPLCCVQYGRYGVNAYNLESASMVLRKNTEAGYLNILAVHAGLEHVNYPSIDHIKAARMLATVSDFVYYGHHPHVIQGVEMFRGSLIAYSLGNFCFDDIYTRVSGDKPLITLTDNNRHGAIMELDIEKNQVVNWKERVIYNSPGEKMGLVQDEDLIKEYNDAVINSETDIEAYVQKRQTLLAKRTAERKAMRDIQWYLKRIRLQYLELVFDGRENKRKYNNSVKKFIDNGL